MESLPDKQLTKRNETATLEQLLPASWDYTPSNNFKVHVTMEVPPQLVYYVPMATEVLKFAWMQYLSFLIPTFMILECLGVRSEGPVGDSLDPSDDCRK
eukprot:symbB.v1.2.004952.t1/scaffold272.1/size248367/7